jgi:uncharacterized membrane protein YkvA (DUF1232 family)
MSQGAESLRKFVQSYTHDVHDILQLAEDENLPRGARRQAIAALNYALMSLDLIPDWEPVIGVCDDAAILRVAMASLVDSDAGELPMEQMTTLGRLANEADTVHTILGDALYDALRRYVTQLGDLAILGRKPDMILADYRMFTAWKREIEGLLKEFRPDLNPLEDPEKVVRDFLSYLRAKLPTRG